MAAWLAYLKSRESRYRNVLAKFGDYRFYKRLDRRLRVSDRRLIKQHNLFVVAVEFPFDDLVHGGRRLVGILRSRENFAELQEVREQARLQRLRALRQPLSEQQQYHHCQ